MEDNIFLRNYKKLIGTTINHSPSKAGNWLEGVLREVEYGLLVMEYTVREEFCNPGNILHGGVASLMLDDVIGGANYVTGNEYLMTSINLNIDFLAAAHVGEKLTVEAKLVRGGRNVNHWKAKITNAEGKLIAKGSSNLIVTQVPISSLSDNSSR
ncbi:PaaI family thioesterase [Litoribacter alkaliphilus]|uniref:PaaI family thioesterase n=1 Tax=Litoribacter ruber TaxID=702568 RepID=A0AAP2CGT4_9BACT|nr:PaaI family thioesterase [Litoribacter alkaliphilus]MBS9523404.1 PaaI family thioesterase [Litoribacter alkaliphilus]